MKPIITAALLLAPALALAEPPQSLEQQRHERTERTIALANELDLDAARALALEQRLAEFDARREQLHEKLRAAHEALQSDSLTAPQLDAQVQALFDLQSQLRALDQEAYRAASKNLSITQRARLALLLTRPPHERRPTPPPPPPPPGAP